MGAIRQGLLKAIPGLLGTLNKKKLPLLKSITYEAIVTKYNQYHVPWKSKLFQSNIAVFEKFQLKKTSTNSEKIT